MTATVYNYSGYDLILGGNPDILVPKNTGTVFYNSTLTNQSPHLFLGDKDIGGLETGNLNADGNYEDSYIGYTTGTENWAGSNGVNLSSGKLFIYKDGKSSVVTSDSAIKPELYVVTSDIYPPPGTETTKNTETTGTSYWYIYLILFVIAIIIVIAIGYWYKKKYVI